MPRGRERRKSDYKPEINIPLRKWSSNRRLHSCHYLFALFILITGWPAIANAQGQKDYEEISVYLSVQSVGGIEAPALIRNDLAYVSVTDVFNFLKIKNTSSASLDSISGFFITPDVPFVIDKSSNRILFDDNTFDLSPNDLIKTETGLYLESSWFGKVFGLDCHFSFRSLSINMTTKAELPIVRELKQEMMRKNLNRLKGEQRADTVLKRSYPFFHFGMADWSVISTQQQTYGLNQTLANLSLGGVLAGGETNIALNYNSSREFREKEQFYLWRRTNNESRYFKQIMAGKIQPLSISSIYSPVVGLQLTNTPSTFRRSFGTYTLTNTTQPGWIVELYVNNELVDYTKADATGFYSFEVPLVYGNSEVRQRFYGPWGEERYRIENISIPFYFLPKGQMEYTISAGLVEDDNDSKYSKGSVSYGLGKRITVSGGLEYLSSVTTGPVMPFLQASWRAAQGLLVSGEYTHGVRSRANLSYRRPSNAQVEVQYAKYQPGQQAVNFSFLEERKIIFSVPFRSKSISLFSRLTLNQFILANSNYETAEWLVSGSVHGVGAHIGTYVFHSGTDPYVYSNFSLTLRLPKGFLLTPQAQYEYNNNTFISTKWSLEKHLFSHAYVNVSYDRNFKSNLENFGLDLRLDLGVTQVGVSARRINDRINLFESARGSMLVHTPTSYVGFNNRTNVGRGGVVVIPFLDLNGNGLRERREPKVWGLKLRSNGGRIQVSKKDTSIRILDMEANASYFIELDGNSFDNIGWRLQTKSLRVIVDPNHLKTIDVPVAIHSEATGTVYLKDRNGNRGQGQIIVSFYRANGSLAGQTLTESDGFFSFLGLTPGTYTVRIDPAQLQKLNMISLPPVSTISISSNREGDVVDGIEFVLEGTSK
jgi:hypothetical protein